ncbi:hypothetical protein ACVIIV_000123 [Bradyrhizobium sp. USDA 4354]
MQDLRCQPERRSAEPKSYILLHTSVKFGSNPDPASAETRGHRSNAKSYSEQIGQLQQTAARRTT